MHACIYEWMDGYINLILSIASILFYLVMF